MVIVGRPAWKVNKENVYEVLTWLESNLFSFEKTMLQERSKTGFSLTESGMALQKFLKLEQDSNQYIGSLCSHLAYLYYCLTSDSPVSYSDFSISDKFSKNLWSYYSSSMGNADQDKVISLTNEVVAAMPQVRFRVMNYLRVKNNRAEKGCPNVTFSHNTYEKLSKLADKKGVSISQLVTEILEHYEG